MPLTSEIISQFVKVTNDKTEEKKETTVFGTIVEYNGSKYVQIDGSELLTPINTTADIKDKDRVTVMIKHHSVTVTGNLSSPSASTDKVGNVDASVTEIGNKISEFEIVVANKVDTTELAVERGRIDTLFMENATVTEKISINEASIEELQAVDVTINEKLTANIADISELKTNKLDVTVANAKYATIEELDATTASIGDLQAAQGEFILVATSRLDAIDAKIENLEVENFDAVYANIDFSNIGKAAMEYFYSTSGLIEDVTVGDGIITGRLVGVTISGDRLEGNTVIAEKLVIKGSDGLYYKLNTDGMKVEAEQTDQNSLNGSIIKAKSITATKISVDDLVAFDATIGGFNITDSAIYSGVKETIDNTTAGIYMGKDGQIAFGNASNFVKFYKDTDGTYKLAISADSIIFGVNNTDLETVTGDVDIAKTTAESAESSAHQLLDNLASLVTDGNGTSLMRETESGWEFSTEDIQAAINTASEGLNDLTNELGNTNNVVDVLKQAVSDLGTIAEYVKIGTYEGEPCIELGEGDSDFKLIITNTRIMFMEGSGMPAYINNQSLYITKAVVKEELQQGGFVWKARSNGNLGLVWKGVSS